MIGTRIEGRFPKKLNTPPVRPINRLGASEETITQLIDENPFPKEEMVRNITTSAGRCTKLAPTMLVESSRPEMMGIFRAAEADKPCLIRKSERRPEHRMPKNAARNGSDAGRESKNFPLMKSMWRYFTRYVGNQVRKNHIVEVTANWPI